MLYMVVETFKDQMSESGAAFYGLPRNASTRSTNASGSSK